MSFVNQVLTVHEIKLGQVLLDLDRLRWAMIDWRDHLALAERSQRALISKPLGIKLSSEDDDSS